MNPGGSGLCVSGYWDPLEVQTGADWTSIGAPKWRAVLARLLLAAGNIVSTDTLIDEVWGNDPPAGPAT